MPEAAISYSEYSAHTYHGTHNELVGLELRDAQQHLHIIDTMEPAEARELAHRLIDAADLAEERDVRK